MLRPQQLFSSALAVVVKPRVFDDFVISLAIGVNIEVNFGMNFFD